MQEGMATELLKVRAVTYFVSLSKDRSAWQAALADAASVLSSLRDAYRDLGYTTQSLRIVTNPFGEYLDTTSVQAASENLTTLKRHLAETCPPDCRIRMAIGEARTKGEIAMACALIQQHGDLCNICVNVSLDDNGFIDCETCDLCAGVVQDLAVSTVRAEGNFNFTV